MSMKRSKFKTAFFIAGISLSELLLMKLADPDEMLDRMITDPAI
jgi:hypothetical protein